MPFGGTGDLDELYPMFRFLLALRRVYAEMAAEASSTSAPLAKMNTEQEQDVKPAWIESGEANLIFGSISLASLITQHWWNRRFVVSVSPIFLPRVSDLVICFRQNTESIPFQVAYYAVVFWVQEKYSAMISLDLVSIRQIHSADILCNALKTFDLLLFSFRRLAPHQFR